jgi:hypothetical protein
VDLWVGALIVVKTAKIENSVESIFHIPATSCTDDFTAFFAGGVLFAECWATAIEAGLSSYRLALGDNIDRRQAHKRATLMRQHAASHFWTAIETAVREVLFPLAAEQPIRIGLGSARAPGSRRRFCARLSPSQCPAGVRLRSGTADHAGKTTPAELEGRGGHP